MQVKLQVRQENQPAILLCPHCGFHYLNHYRVEVFDRNEDANDGTHVTVEHGQAPIIDHNMQGNPSSRRHGLTIRFTCEGCSADSVLRLAQHKGETEIEFTATQS